ncbi:uncharacterized protein SCODWIG_01085 [Saccharomycodes ludwigii]|uniref:Uncharacterized protein n=1 Tax=Saccharomycodes ludwigii TaxID=36035 RepID=A0A376B4D5_9ASCO|nr:hypothetical protein SCDLUD_001127 [Saccharomycodes ludwigii]KAH3903487.1 hypothetical protein SCDLUD_001127 [Saccharomycodes ludwigii]SSD59324.1 uncharacterized protein SCODWIG_01085 [Saccharomycodes ludwigii]
MLTAVFGNKIPFIINKIAPTQKDYTGVKIMKKHVISNRVSTIEDILSLNFCYKGKLVKSIDIDKHLDKKFKINDWKAPICFYLDDTPQNSYSLRDNTTHLVSHIKTYLTKNKYYKFLFKPKNILNETLKSKSLKNIDKFHCFKVARRKKYSYRDLNIFFPQQWVGGLFYCKQDTALKKLVLNNYLDDNLEMLSINNHDNSGTEKDTDSGNDYKIMCNISIAKPVLPLIADNFRRYWTEYDGLKKNSKHFIDFKYVKIIPYLLTPSIDPDTLNFIPEKNDNGSDDDLSSKFNSLIANTPMDYDMSPFRKLKIVDLLFNNKNSTASKNNNTNTKVLYPKKRDELWFNEINVEEEYDYDALELSKFDQLIQYTLTALNNISKSEKFKEKYFPWNINIDFNKFLNNDKIGLNNNNNGSKSLDNIKHKIISNPKAHLSSTIYEGKKSLVKLGTKFWNQYSSMEDRIVTLILSKLFISELNNLQNKWGSLNITKEYFKY